ncbi:MAG: cell division protein FtsZ [Parcubacteria group bacterium]|nr:cell division protein FtsZ [Parcubacteria group bacterium]
MPHKKNTRRKKHHPQIIKIKPEVSSPHAAQKIRLKVIGVGGAGGNVVSRLFDKRIEGIELVSINTDWQGLKHSKADIKIQIGKNSCRGLGAGMDPLRGREAAEEAVDEIAKVVQNTDLIFIAAGLGGGTGSGASPVIANLARQAGALTIAVVTKPFSFEGEKRLEIADEAWQKLFAEVDAIVTIPNDRVFNIIDEKTPILEAFYRIDEVLREGVKGISDLITFPGLINLDFANIRTIMSNAGSSLLGLGKAKGADRAKIAAQRAVSSPLLDISIEGATKVLFNVSGGKDMSLVEINNAARVITESISKSSQVIFGTSFDKELNKGEIKVTVIAGGFETEIKEVGYPLPLGVKIPIADENESSEDENVKKIIEENKELEIPTFLRKKKK